MDSKKLQNSKDPSCPDHSAAILKNVERSRLLCDTTYAMEKLSLKNRYSRLKVARKIRQQVAIPACRVLLISSGWRVMIAAMPPPNAYTAHTNARMSAKEPNTSTAIPPLPRLFRVPYRSAELGAAMAVPPGAASYLEAHFACTCSATKRPSSAGRPSTRAWDLSTKVSGSGSLPM